MKKRFLTYDEQLAKLISNKNITIDVDQKEVIDYLERHSYYNFINSTKLILCKEKLECHIYENMNFSQWRATYEEMLKLTNYVIEEILSIERHLCSLLSYYIAHSYITNNILEPFMKAFVSYIENEDSVSIPSEAGNNYIERFKYIILHSWKYMHFLTFGSLVAIINKCDERFERECLNKLGLNIYQLKNLVKIRNDLFHHTPLYITLSKGKNAEERRRRRKSIEVIMKNNANYVHYKEVTNKLIKK